MNECSMKRDHFKTHRIHGTGVFTYVWLIFIVHVGKSTSPMDPMGKVISSEPSISFEGQTVSFEGQPVSVENNGREAMTRGLGVSKIPSQLRLKELPDGHILV